VFIGEHVRLLSRYLMDIGGLEGDGGVWWGGPNRVSLITYSKHEGCCWDLQSCIPLRHGSWDKLIDRVEQRIVALIYSLQVELVFRVVFVLPAG
jgi:hypothetical protein